MRREGLLKLLRPILIFLAALLILSWNIDLPDYLKWDEVYYVKAARSLLAGQGDPNWEHPPLVKYLMAFFMQIFGDTPWGWRGLSVLCGAFSVVLIDQIALLLFSSLTWLPTVMVVLGQFLFTESQLATLESPVGFILLTTVFAFLKFNETRKMKWISACAMFLGVGLFSKWTVVPIWGVFLITAAIIFFNKREKRDLIVFLTLLLTPLILYFSMWGLFHLLQPESPGSMGFWERQIEMWNALMIQAPSGVSKVHPMMTHFTTWPFSFQRFMLHYEIIPGPDRIARALVLHGNPMVLGTSFCMTCALTIYGIYKREFNALFFSALFWGSYLIFATPGRVASFYYYYFTPSLFLCLSGPLFYQACTQKISSSYRRAGAWAWIILSCAWVLYFFPLLTGRPLSNTEYHARYDGYFTP